MNNLILQHVTNLFSKVFTVCMDGIRVISEPACRHCIIEHSYTVVAFWLVLPFNGRKDFIRFSTHKNYLFLKYQPQVYFGNNLKSTTNFGLGALINFILVKK